MKDPQKDPQDVLLWLQNWYLSMCDGEWEHDEGLKITSSDNPGWIIEINVKGTPLEGRDIEYKLTEKSENDWYGYSIKNSIYKGVGDPLKLDFLILNFRKLLA